MLQWVELLGWTRPSQWCHSVIQLLFRVVRAQQEVGRVRALVQAQQPQVYSQQLRGTRFELFLPP